MHTKSSMNVKPVSDNSEAHNLRKGKPLDYVKSEDTHKNRSWSIETIHDARTRIEETYKKSVGQKMQKKATPIREGVVNLGKNQNMDTLKKMSEKLHAQFGIKAIQIHIHEDEGHHQSKFDKAGEEIKWKQNRHAHIVFDWTDPSTGKSRKLGKAAMSEIQTTVANELGMERGQSSDKKHLNAMEYKLQEMKKEAVQRQKHLKQLNKEVKAEEFSKNIKKGVSESLKRFGGVNTAQKQEKEIEELKNNLKKEREYNSKLESFQEELIQERRILVEQRAKHIDELKKRPTREEFEREQEARKFHKQNAEGWKKNCINVAIGKVKPEELKKFMIEKGFIQEQQKRGRGI